MSTLAKESISTMKQRKPQTDSKSVESRKAIQDQIAYGCTEEGFESEMKDVSYTELEKTISKQMTQRKLSMVLCGYCGEASNAELVVLHADKTMVCNVFQCPDCRGKNLAIQYASIS